MSKRNRTLDKQLHYGLCGAIELVRRIASVIGCPCFDRNHPLDTSSTSNSRWATG